MKKNGRILLMITWCICCSFSLSAQKPTPEDEFSDKVCYVHFPVGSSALKLDFNGNRKTLEQFVDRVNQVINSELYSVTGVRIVGYASPEGSVELNQRLSRERAEVLKDYMIAVTGMPEAKIEVEAGGENWNELLLMVETSKMAHKDKVKEILMGGYSETDRERLLQRLPEGTYRYMLHTFYPKLRSASSLQLVERPPVVVAVSEPAPQVTTQAVEIIDTVQPAPPAPLPEVCRCTPPWVGVKTNLAYWATAIIPNIELEFFFAQRYSATVEGVYRWPKDTKASHNNANLWYVSPEVRFYLHNDASYTGHYLGAYGQYGEYDMKFGEYGRQGDYKGGGFSYGYIFKFRRFDCLYFDLGLSLGYGRMSYDRYYWYDPCNAFDGHNSRNYWGPTKLKASLMWRF